MNFELNAEQQMLSDMVNRLFEKEHDEQTRRLALADPGYQPSSLWKTLAEQGVLAVNVPDSAGGNAASQHDAAIATHLVMQAMGRHLALEPFVSSAVVGTSLMAEAAEASLQKLMLPAMMEGRIRLTPAVLEADDPCNIRHVATRATSQPNAWVLDGRKIGIIDAPDANWMIVSARTSGGTTDENGISLFLVSRTARGVEMEYGRGLDGTEIATATLRGVMVATNDLIGTQDQGYAPLERAVQRGIAALCSEATGTMEKLLSICIDYLKVRRQFGRALAEFQVLQHRIAELHTAFEQAQSAALLAAAATFNPDAVERRKAIATAKTVTGKAALRIGHEAVQLHGGVGMTEELMVGHYFRRLMAIDATWGNVEHHTEVYAGLMAND